jgi:thiosulfate/3-mercaptopyruvate sulfurtransferase
VITVKGEILMSKSNLLCVESLKAQLQNPNLVVLFTSMADIATGQPEALPLELIPRSVFFDFENVFCDHHSGFPHTMADEDHFQREAQKLGINANSHIVVYDSKGLYCSPRVWWMFKAMGHDNIWVLDGGLPAWLAKQYPVSASLEFKPEVGDFTSVLKSQAFVNCTWLLSHLNQSNVIDARSSGRFNGTAPEPRVGLRSGHIPGSVSLPFTECIEGGKLKTVTELTPLFAQRKVNPLQPLVFSCGSGVTACILALAASQVGYENVSVYDGSWSEWGAIAELPIEC